MADIAPDGTTRLEGDLRILPPRGAPLPRGPHGAFEVRPLLLSAPGPGGDPTLAGRVVFRGFSFGDVLPIQDVEGEAVVESLRLGATPEGRGTVRIRSARILDLSVRDVDLPIVWRDSILTVDPLVGVLASGQLRGRVRLHTEEPMAFEGEARLHDFRLEALREDIAPTGPPLSGRGQAEVRFQSRSGELADLTGRGTVSVREGDLGELPLLANVFTFVSQLLDAEDPPRFERADLCFTVEDEVVRFQRFDLSGPSFEMPGTGTVDLAGFVDLTFTPDFIKSFLVPGILQMPVVGDVLDAVLREDLLYAIRLRGDLASAEPEVVAFPPLGLASDSSFEGTGTPEPPPRRLPRWFR